MSHPELDATIAWIESHATQATLEGMARYGIPATNALGVSVGELKAYAKARGKDHALATALWESGWYEARLLAAFVGEPDKLTAKQMDAWAAEFDSWAICDTVCYALFDRSKHAWTKVRAWSTARAEFKKRAAFALLWGLSVHDKQAADEAFLGCFELIEHAAVDERHYVKKGVDMALRAIGKRNAALREAAVALATRLRDTPQGAKPWIGRSVLRDLTKATRKKKS